MSDATRRGWSGRPPLSPDQHRPRLSFAQERLWFLAQLEPDSTVYNALRSITLIGPLNVGALQVALDDLIARHAVLRTGFDAAGGEPWARLRSDVTLPLPIVDLAVGDPPDRERALHDALTDLASRPFDLARDLLVRAALVRVGGDAHVLALVIHHILTDHWSWEVLWRELGAIYTALCAGQQPDLPPLPLQYGDYAEWQRVHLDDDRLERHLRYWKTQLAGMVPLNLPEARPRAVTPAGPAVARALDLDPALVQQIRRASRARGVTLFTTLLAAYQLVLGRWARQDDVAVGAAFANRQRPEHEALIGLFVNTLVLRTDLSGVDRFADLLTRVRPVVLGALDHQEYPFEKLVEALNPPRIPGRTPLVQALLNLQSVPVGAPCFGDLRVTRMPVRRLGAIVDLELHLNPSEGGGLDGTLLYDSGLFETPVIERIAGDLERVLRGVADDPEAAVSSLLNDAEDAGPRGSAADVACLASGDRQGVLDAPRSAALAEREPASVVALIETQAAKTPGAPALVCDGRQLTYQELDRRANQVARALASEGVTPGTLVGVCLDRSLDLVVALLGVLKAGAAYVPLDPEYPAARLAFMIDDSQAPIAIADAGLARKLPPTVARVLCLDRDRSLIDVQSDRPSGVPVTGEALAYVMYTSGSTGQPKGVMVPHRAVGNYLTWMRDTFPVDASDRFLLKTTFAFDLSVWEIFLPLTVGATLVVAPAGHLGDPAEVVSLVARNGITVLQAVPAQLRMLLTRPEFDTCRTLTQIFAGGEVLPPSVAAEVCARLPVSLHNLYGPTETCINSLWHTYERTAGATAPVPIGRPIANTDVHLLDEALQPVLPGEVGEICIGGLGVAAGYWRRPDLTAERFVPHPVRPAPARLYRTGDRGRYRSDGRLEFLGRLDQQVKLRGYRIELGEIETVLGAHPGLQAAVVVAREDHEGDTRLVAYVVARAASPPPAASLADFIRDRLPEYMVPAAFVFLETLPLTASGKIDRRRLPDPDGQRPELPTAYAGPGSSAEQALAAIWAEALGLDRVGVDDNFFALGGHSLLAVRVATRVRQRLRVDLPVRSIFEHPTVAELARSLSSLPRLPESGDGAPVATLDEGQETPPLSFAQQRLWFLDQFDAGSSAYNLSTALHVQGPLDTEALRHALEVVVHRHAPLRTTYRFIGDEPRQIVAAAAPVALPVLDLPRDSAAESLRSGADRAPEGVEAAITRHVRDEARRPFDLANDLPWRARLLRVSDRDHVLLLTVHHIATDGWSQGILLRELSAVYAACRAGEPSPLGPLPVQYTDHAAWQREWLQGERLTSLTGYWRTALHRLSPLEIPTDRPRPALRSYEGLCHRFELDAELTRAVGALARQEGATLFMTLLAAFQVLLSRYAGQTDIAVGIPVANRTRTEVEPLIGFFVNTLVLRVVLDGSLSFREVLARVRRQALDAYDHQELPFDRLVEELRPDRDLSRNPLVDVIFALQNAPEGELQLAGCEVTPIDRDERRARLDLELHVTEEAGGTLKGLFIYDTDLFDGATVQRLAAHLETLLRAVTRAPADPVADIPLLADREREQILAGWNATAAPYPSDRPVHRLFEAQANRTPDAVALSWRGRTLSYAEVNRRANRLARYLRSRGVGPDVVVAVAVERSPDLVLALLAVLKAGGAYLPLDLRNPASRQRVILDESGARLLVTAGSHAIPMAEHGIEIIRLDAVRARIDEQDGADPDDTAGAGDLAYVMYTSGSTGVPKGVEIPHRAIARLVWADVVPVGPSDAVLHLAPASFDASTFEIWVPLLRGARCVIYPEPDLLDLAVLEDVLRTERVTRLWLTASLFNMVIDSRPSSLEGIEYLLIGGEALSVPHVRRALDLYPALHLVNGYGPTEVTTFSCTHAIERPLEPEARSIPIGRPIANTTAYVLDDGLQPVPIGVAGELYLGGDGLARGYRHRPDLTAERFIPHPFSKGSADRLYRTGDRVRARPDGTIEFLGRTDQQVKLRGFRIELAEIEQALARHADVEGVAVAVAQEPGAEKRLVAHVVPRPGAQLTRRDLVEHARRLLPDYMMPSVFVLQDTLPLTASGKVDRQHLSGAGGGSTPGDARYEAPGSPAEAAIAGIWCDVLKLERVGIHDNFFSLGGHSLLATQVVMRLRTLFDEALPLRVLFEAPTIAGLAQRVEPSDWGPAASGSQTEALPPIPVHPATTAVPMSFAEQRLWLLAQVEPGSTAYNMPYAIRLEGTLDVDALSRALETIVGRHAILRTTFTLVDDEPQQVIHPAGAFALPLVDLSTQPRAASEREAIRLAQAEAERPFDLGSDRPIRASLVRIAPHLHLLLLSMHHIVSDEWSQGVLWKELGVLYGAYAAGTPSPLAPLSLQYTDFAVWQREWLQGERLATLLRYWRTALGGLVPLALPADRPRPDHPKHRAARHVVIVERATVARLRQVGREESATLFMVLLAAFKILAGRLAGQEDVAIGAPIANRTRRELEDVIGFFVNVLVLRTDLGGMPTFRELLCRVRRVALDGYEHQDLPFERLIEDLHPARDGRSPLLHVLFNMVGQRGEAAPRLAGLETTFDIPGNIQAKFDLTLYLVPSGTDLQVTALYDTDIFEGDRIAALLDAYVELLRQVGEAPDRPIGEYSLVTPGARAMLPDPTLLLRAADGVSAPEQVLQVALERTDAAAICWGDRTWTYGELAAAATTVARDLLADGVRPGEVVALEGDPSFGLVAAFIGIMLAGAAVLPLDPALPPRRKSFMAQQSTRLVASGVAGENRWWRAAGSATSAIDLNPQDGRLVFAARGPAGSPALPALSGEASAYVFFTSGSTGVPKGILGHHRGLSHFVTWQRETFGVGPGHRVAQLTSLSFDVVLRDIFLPLTSGATLCLPEARLTTLAAPFEWLARQRVTIVHMVPSILRHWLDQAAPPSNWSPELLFCAGEALTAPLVARWRAAFPGCRVVNLYGPTETCMAKCWYLVPDHPGPGVQPAGRPLPQTQALVLNSTTQLCGIGERGEIVIRTPFGTRGYLEQTPAEERSRFRPNPFRLDPGDVVYFTGDAGRYRPDGAIDILGRLDDQVRLLGVCVEPREIEAAIEEHPGVHAVSVGIRASEAGEPELVAWVVGENLDADTLRAHLAGRVPAAMHPRRYVFLTDLPLLPNGKVDRAALPAPGPAESRAAGSTARGFTLTEARLARLWRDVLGNARVRADEDFFSVGGHSLLAVQLFARIEREFGERLPLSTLFTHGTIEQLAALLDGSRRRAPWTPIVPIKPTGDRPPLFLVHGLGGEVLSFQALAQHLPAGQPVFGIQAAGPGAEVDLPVEVEALSSLYVDVLSGIDPHGPYYVGGYSSGGPMALALAHALMDRGKQVKLLVLIDGGLPQRLQDVVRPRHTAWSLLRQMAYWVVDDALATPVREWWPRSLSKARVWRSTTRLRFGRPAPPLDIRDALGVWRFPESYRQYLEVRLDALRRYDPRPYPGRTALLRARTGRLFGPPGSFRDDAWRALVRGPLTIRYVPGSHHNVLHMPWVVGLAREITACLDEAERAEPGDAP